MKQGHSARKKECQTSHVYVSMLPVTLQSYYFTGKKKTSKCMQPHRVILRKIIARIAGVLRERINMKVYDSYQQHAF